MVIVALAAAIVVANSSVGATGGDDRSRLPITINQPITSDRGEVLVEKGDHLWSISADQFPSNATTAEISALWRDVIAVNLDRLRSGDADLIYAGEVVLVPDPSSGSQ